MMLQIVPLARLEAFRALKFFRLESFGAKSVPDMAQNAKKVKKKYEKISLWILLSNLIFLSRPNHSEYPTLVLQLVWMASRIICRTTLKEYMKNFSTQQMMLKNC